MHARSIWPSVDLASDRHLLVEGHLQTRLRKESSMRTSTFRRITAPFAAFAVIVSLGSSPVLARAGGGGGSWRLRGGADGYALSGAVGRRREAGGIVVPWPIAGERHELIAVLLQPGGRIGGTVRLAGVLGRLEQRRCRFEHPRDPRSM